VPGYTASGPIKLLSWKWAEAQLRKTRVYLLATTRQDGRPHVMPIWGVWFKGAMYLSTSPYSQKSKNIERRPNCVLCVDQNGKTVIVEGTASMVSAGTCKTVIPIYKRKYKWDMRSLGNTIYEVRPMLAFGMDDSIGPQCSTRWEFRRSRSN